MVYLCLKGFGSKCDQTYVSPSPNPPLNGVSMVAITQIDSVSTTANHMESFSNDVQWCSMVQLTCVIDAAIVWCILYHPLSYTVPHEFLRIDQHSCIQGG